MASLIMLSALAIPMSNMNLFSDAMASEKITINMTITKNTKTIILMVINTRQIIIIIMNR